MFIIIIIISENWILFFILNETKNKTMLHYDKVYKKILFHLRSVLSKVNLKF